MSAPVAIVIEDEPQIRRFVRGALEAEGWQVFEAATAQQGLSEAGTRKPDLLVLDLGLPDRNGLEVIRDVRSWSAVPIIVLSARVDEVDKIAALDAGADEVSRLAGQVGEVAFPLIADPLGALAQKFGAWNPVKNKLEPLSYIVDKSGKIVWAQEGSTALDPATLLAGFFQMAR